MRKDLKSNHACLAIEEVATSIEINIKYLCYYHFINVTTFCFLGDSIVKGGICGLKRGDTSVSKNMNIDKSVMTQIQISKTKARKKLKYILCYEF